MYKRQGLLQQYYFFSVLPILILAKEFLKSFYKQRKICEVGTNMYWLYIPYIITQNGNTGHAIEKPLSNIMKQQVYVPFINMLELE